MSISPSLNPNPTRAVDAEVFLGLDFGTSGARLIAIDASHQPVFQTHHRFLENNWPEWRATLFRLLDALPLHLRQATRGIACCGTSSTCLVCDEYGNPLAPAALYNEIRPIVLPSRIPSHHLAASPSSSLTKLLWFAERYPSAAVFLHQADWLAFQLHGQLGLSDYHNTLKLGYDVEKLEYPSWLMAMTAAHLLPRVLSPGEIMGTLLPSWVAALDFNPECRIHAGTTDSIAAFFASGSRQPGQAVTSLGSTLVLKLLSERRVESVDHGIYSHRCGNMWLAGGASNCGAAVLENIFGRKRLVSLSRAINPDIPSSLNYYPLPATGERFPICDPNLLPRLGPRPTDDVEYLHGLLESLARIEADGYGLLETLGATPVTEIRTSRGGASNMVWQAIRQRVLGRPIHPALNIEAAFGAALIAAEGTRLLYSAGS